MPDPASRRLALNAWTAVASLGAGLAVSAWILSRSGGSLAAVTSVPWPAHACALLVVAIEVLARSARLTFLARGLGQPLRLRTAVETQLGGDALAAATPFRAGSDPAKLAMLGSSGLRLGTAGALLLGEMSAETFALLACALAIAVAAPQDRWVGAGLAGYAVLASLAAVTALLLLRAPTETAPRLWSRLGLGDGRWVQLRRAVTEFRFHAGGLRTLPVRWSLAAAGATAVHIAARLAILPILFASLAGGASGVPAATPDGLILRPFFVLYGTALLPAPGGGGVVEVTFAALLAGTLGPAGLAATVLWWRLYTFYLSAAAGGVLLGVRAGLGRRGYASTSEPSHSLSRSHRRDVTWPQQLVGTNETTTTASEIA